MGKSTPTFNLKQKLLNKEGDKVSKKTAMCHQKNQGISIFFLEVFFPTSPLLIIYFYDVTFFWDTYSTPILPPSQKTSILSPNFYVLGRLPLKTGFCARPDTLGETAALPIFLTLFAWYKTRQNLISEFIQNALSFNWLFHKRNQTKETHKQMDERTDLLKHNVASLLIKTAVQLLFVGLMSFSRFLARIFCHRII